MHSIRKRKKAPMLMSSSRLSKQTRSKKARSSRALKLSLAAVAGAAGGMGNDASAEIVTANLNSTATVGNAIYFTYSAGTIGTSISADGIKGLFFNGKFGSGGSLLSLFSTATNARSAVVGQSSPFALNALISSDTSTWAGGKSVGLGSAGYYGVRFWAGGSDYNYGWVDVTLTPTGLTFGLAAVETTINLGILAGPGSPVPEIDPASAGSAASLVAVVLAMVEQRRRRRIVPTGSAVA
jgi:hypothetical protein